MITILFSPVLLSAQQTKSQEEPDWNKNDDHNFLPLGAVTRDQILTLGVFNHNFGEYVPKPDAIKVIHDCSTSLEVKIFFGDWCIDSKKQVPAFLKTLELAGNNKIRVTYINVNRDKKEPADILAGWNITTVPTFIVLVNDKEIARIAETPKTSMDADFAEILSKLEHQE
jgi:thiol-disulfide isomerase/thioredoxin